jgi:hypothetical protein
MTQINNIINDNPTHHQIEPFNFCTQLRRLSYPNIAFTHMQNGGFLTESTWIPLPLSFLINLQPWLIHGKNTTL